MKFTWDTDKAIVNYEKHGVSFEEASLMFSDLDALEWVDEKHSTPAETRYNRLGMSPEGRILFVVYTPREGSDGKEKIRIISARCASKKERQAYAG